MFSVNGLEGFAVSVTELENDGKIGIPLAIKTYVKDKKSTSATTPVILYIVGTNTERIGTDSDETIISDLLSRGYVVSVFDYYGSPLAVTPMLEESIQRIRSGLALGRDGWRERLLGGALCASPYVYVLPSGYNITRQANFWSFDRHGTAGQFDFILSVWNNDFLGVWGNKGIITYPDGRKESVREYTESLPNGRVSEIYQCIRRNAKPIEMNLYMDIIYPTSPEKKVPVMLYAQSGQNTVGTWNKEDRHHLSGFLFGGYAVALFDHPYIPMSRSDNWGYFDGDGLGSVGGVTGDNYTYSLGMQNNMKSNMAAVRYLRYLAATESEKYCFDSEAFGIIGISKTGNVLRLGHKNPEILRETRYFVGHHGESRYEAGEIHGDGRGEGGEDIICGGEPQPWLTYPDGSPISPRVQFVYTSVGSADYTISEGHAPLYSCGTMQKHGSYNRFWPLVMSRAYTHDVPALGYVCPDVGHSFGIGPDRDFGVDTTLALYEMANYYLKGSAPRCEYIYPVDSSEIEATAKLQVCFNAPIPQEEAKKISLKDSTGREIKLLLASCYGDTHWDITPTELCDGEKYSLLVPDTITSADGRCIKAARSSSFTVKSNRVTPAKSVAKLCGNNRITLSPPDGLKAIRFFVSNNAANTVLAESEEGEILGSVNLSGVGSYEIALDGEAAKYSIVTLRLKRVPAVYEIYRQNFDSDTMPKEIESTTVNLVSDERDRDGSGYSLKVADDIIDDTFAPYHSFYRGFHNIIKLNYADSFCDEDYGRRFTVRISVYDTATRQLGFIVGKTAAGEEIDLRAYRSNHTTKIGEWTDHVFGFDLKNPKLLGEFCKNEITVFGEMLGAKSKEHPLYIDAISVSETVTEADISSIKFIE